MLLQIEEVRKVKCPDRAHPTDAGLDFFCPEITYELIEDMKKNPANNNVEYPGNSFIIPPGENVVIPAGIKVEIPFGYMGLFLNKSGVASKQDLLVGAQVIDTFYAGEVHIDLHNVGKQPITIQSGIKLAQMVITPVVHVEPTYSEDLYSGMRLEQERGDNGFGSTDKKNN